MNQRGFFIVFEGIDGSGKSTQAQLLYDKLKSINNKVFLTSEPSDGEIGKFIRKILNGEKKTDYLTIAALFVADRLEHLNNEENGLKKLFDNGYTIICDRYYFSNFAYNSMHVNLDWLIEANKICREILKPDMNIFIDVDADESMNRLSKNRYGYELFEKKDILNTVRNNYFKTFDKLKETENISIINGKQTVEKIKAEVWNIIEQIWKY